MDCFGAFRRFKRGFEISFGAGLKYEQLPNPVWPNIAGGNPQPSKRFWSVQFQSQWVWEKASGLFPWAFAVFLLLGAVKKIAERY